MRDLSSILKILATISVGSKSVLTIQLSSGLLRAIHNLTKEEDEKEIANLNKLMLKMNKTFYNIDEELV